MDTSSQNEQHDNEFRCTQFVAIFYCVHLNRQMKNNFLFYCAETCEKINKNMKNIKNNERFQKLMGENRDTSEQIRHDLKETFKKVTKDPNLKEYGIEVPHSFRQCDYYFSFIGYMIDVTEFYARWECMNYLYAQDYLKKTNSKRYIIEEFVEEFGKYIPTDLWMCVNLHKTDHLKAAQILLSEMAKIVRQYRKNTVELFSDDSKEESGDESTDNYTSETMEESDKTVNKKSSVMVLYY